MRMIETERKRLEYLFLAALLGVVLWHVGETTSLMVGSLRDQATVHTPWLIVVAKLLLLVSIFMLLVFMGWKHGLDGRTRFGFFFLLASALLAFVLSPESGFWALLCGMKWLLPMLMVFLLVPVVDRPTGLKLAKVALLMATLNFIIQILQVFFMHPWYGWWPGTQLAARSPGLFFIPSSAAAFVCFSVLLFASVAKSRVLLRKIAVLGLASVFLTLSGTGFTVMLVVLGALLSGNKWRLTVPFIVPLAYGATKLVMPLFRGKEYFEASLGVRIDILSGVSGVSGAGWPHFGAGTTSAWLLKFNLGVDIHPVMTDSFLAQLVINLGLVALLVYVALLTLGSLAAWLNGRLTALLWLIALGMFSVTFPITEAFPTFLLVAWGVAYEVRRGSYQLGKVFELFDRVRYCRV